MADDSEKFELVPPENDPPVEAPVQSTYQGADEMMERGLKAMREQDHAAAIRCFSHALNIKISQYGKSAVECCDAYHKYGCALFYKALQKSPLPMAGRQSTVWESQQDGESTKKRKTTDGDECEVELAWKILNIAWEIVENTDDQSRSITTTVNILNDLAGVAELRGDAESCVHYCGKLLSILEGMLEPDNIHLAVWMSNYLEKCSMYESAIPYCQKAIFLCDSRRMKLLKKSLATSSSTPSLKTEEPAEHDLTPDEVEAEIRKVVSYAEKFKNQLQYLEYIVLKTRAGMGNMKDDGISDIIQGLRTSTISSSHSRFANQLKELMPIPSTISSSQTRLANQLKAMTPIAEE